MIKKFCGYCGEKLIKEAYIRKVAEAQIQIGNNLIYYVDDGMFAIVFDTNALTTGKKYIVEKAPFGYDYIESFNTACNANGEKGIAAAKKLNKGYALGIDDKSLEARLSANNLEGEALRSFFLALSNDLNMLNPTDTKTVSNVDRLNFSEVVKKAVNKQDKENSAGKGTKLKNQSKSLARELISSGPNGAFNNPRFLKTRLKNLLTRDGYLILTGIQNASVPIASFIKAIYGIPGPGESTILADADNANVLVEADKSKKPIVGIGYVSDVRELKAKTASFIRKFADEAAAEDEKEKEKEEEEKKPAADPNKIIIDGKEYRVYRVKVNQKEEEEDEKDEE